VATEHLVESLSCLYFKFRYVVVGRDCKGGIDEVIDNSGEFLIFALQTCWKVCSVFLAEFRF